ncbi:flagellar motor switch protein FliM [Leptospira broomii serovar Hurstbridge str. 5399]|uniref:Flagellar motor switch protein FliM n=4 Tax=Leptospira TaxID=171 RepID=V6HW68_9LEPT|nr:MULTISPECIES: flagellar motor switch protein FliM [Leptospira]EPG75403.1 flagellar motor switch protein FliM [Leptospira fainei serovar Hurstbridge str. BUT 6]EQA37164.1 flagellar motor switch protein FliM [Leptospira inadai serovar Lyme str. 10]EQA43186.1 flagellar motor switch protein FliM [Leptospira broomii serovar Hurstbridge str. 5399]PNV76557.1 flagellar motor switch protein FliM [Leptospira inadai serovar Lyme]
MTEILSQDEIDALLNAISSGEVSEDEYSSVGEQKKVKIYDFKRPDKFSKDQIRTLQMMHETFARLATTGLSAQLRALVHVHVAAVDQLTYEEFIRSIPNPTTLAVINMDPLRGSAILEIDPSISFTIIDRLFGGKGETAKISRELSEIEMSVMEGIIVRILGNMREAWSTVIDLRPRLGNIETNPQFAQVVPPNDMVVLINLETKIGEVEGLTNLCIPYITIEPIINKLSAQYWYSSIRKGELDENRSIIQERLDQVQIPVIAEVGSVDISILDFMNLTVGDVVKLENTTTRADMLVKVGERKKFKCLPGRVGNRLAIQIGDRVEDIPDELLGSTRSEQEY